METSGARSVTLEKLVALCKRRGFIYQSADIYGGINGVYDTGPAGVLMMRNIRAFWEKSLQHIGGDILPFEGALLGPQLMWEASGHVKNFHDPMVDCLVCKHRFRADEIDLNKPCSHCGNKKWTDVRQFNMMFQTNLGAAADQATVAYLRPETAQAIFVNFKNIYSSNRVKIPFGVSQIGKAFRNEITPKQFLFRAREFEQMEVEWFCAPHQSDTFFEQWCALRRRFYHDIGIKDDNIRLRAHEKEELSHYSRGTSDMEYYFPFGWKELEGVAHRGDFDLSQHMKFSGKDLAVFDEETKQTFIPHVIECSVGVGRLFLALLCDAYDEDVAEGEQRVVLRLHPKIAPIKAAFFPLTKQQNENTMRIFQKVSKQIDSIHYDASGSIGKRYRRQDEIGTPLCFTYDFNSDVDNCVTVRHRDSMRQERIAIDTIVPYLSKALSL